MGLSWRESRAYDFSQTSHINIQEIRSMKAELVARAEDSVEPELFTNGVDRMVAVGSWGKGKSQRS